MEESRDFVNDEMAGSGVGVTPEETDIDVWVPDIQAVETRAADG